jgi:hypothetical protein
MCRSLNLLLHRASGDEEYAMHHYTRMATAFAQLRKCHIAVWNRADVHSATLMCAHDSATQVADASVHVPDCSRYLPYVIIP